MLVQTHRRKAVLPRIDHFFSLERKLLWVQSAAAPIWTARHQIQHTLYGRSNSPGPPIKQQKLTLSRNS